MGGGDPVYGEGCRQVVTKLGSQKREVKGFTATQADRQGGSGRHSDSCLQKGGHLAGGGQTDVRRLVLWRCCIYSCCIAPATAANVGGCYAGCAERAVLVQARLADVT
jgi:hypothetical protein